MTKHLTSQMLLGLFFVFLVIFPLGQLLRIEISPQITLQPIDVIAGIMAIFGFTRPKNRLTLMLLAFLAVASFSLALQLSQFSFYQLLPATFYLLRLFAYTGFFFAVSWLIKERQLSWVQALSYLLVVGTTIAVLGLLQYFIFPDTRPLLEYGWDNHYFRLIGTFLDPAFVGILLVFFICVVVSFPWGREADKKFLSLLLFLLGFFALMFTYSRASYLGFLAASTLLYIVRRNWIVFLLSLILFATTIATLPRSASEGTNLSRTSTVVYRANNYQKVWEIFLEHPLFGIGYNNLRYYLDAGRHSGSGSDSSLLFILATTGIAGALVFCFLLKELVVLGWESRKTPAGLAFLTSGAALLVHSIFNNSIFYPWVATFVFILVALSFNSRESKQRL